jgi:sec-independent protein translocase protein TatA
MIGINKRIMFRDIGIVEIVLIAVILLVLFGGDKLPEIGKSLGQAVKEFKKALSGKDKK